MLYRGYLWPATYDNNGEVTKVFIPYTVKTGGWFSGLGKDIPSRSHSVVTLGLWTESQSPLKLRCILIIVS